jgi:hypothetical protein
MTTRTIVWNDRAASPYPLNEVLKATYKGINWERGQEYLLYSIVVPEGYDIVKQLSGQFTKLETLQNAVDKFIETNGSVEAAFIELNAPPKRGRPFKNKQKPSVADLLRKEADEQTKEMEILP